MQRVFSGSPYEPQAGFCRALRIGDRVEVAGTAPLDTEGRTVAPGQAGPQARRCLEVISQALKELGSGPEDVIRTRIYLTRAEDFPAVAAVHGEFFSASPPVATGIVVAGLLDPDWVVEIEAEAQLRARIRALVDLDRYWMSERAHHLFGAEVVVSRGQAWKVADLEGFVVVRGPERLALATYRVEGEECELVTIDAYEKHRGHGTRLLAQVEEAARTRGCKRIWLVTTNDNLDALRFYQRRGYRLSAVYPGAVDEVSRPLKPQIPQVGYYEIPLRDELILEKIL